MSVDIIGEEKRYTPEWIEREMLKIGGRALDGNPLFRCIWGANRWVQGPNLEIVHPYRVDRWHLEKRLYSRIEDGAFDWEWEHCYTLGQCPHMKPTDKAWCKRCQMTGGEYLDIETEFSAVERCVRLIIKSTEMQDKAAQRAALIEREQKKKEQQDIQLREMVADAAPARMKRSYEAPMHIGARETPLGIEPGFRQIDNKEIK